MAERRENSVLFSLKELRNIEEDRVRQEEESERARIDSERKAREDELQRAKDEEERKVREEQDRIRREQDEKDRSVREHDLRLKETERRAQIEANTKLEQARIEADARARIEGKKFPVGAVIMAVVAFLLVAGGAMAYLVRQHAQELERQRAEQQRLFDEQEKKMRAEGEAEQHKLELQLSTLQKQLDKASSDAERDRIRGQMRAASESHAAARGGARPSQTKIAKEAKEPKEEPVKKKKPISTDSNDPLGGLGF